MYSDINCYVIEGNDRRYVKAEINHDLVKLVKFTKLAVYGKGLFHARRKNNDGTPIVSSMGMHMESLFAYGELYSKDYKFAPLIEFFFEEYRKHPINDYALVLNEHDPDGFSVDLFNDFVKTMRAKAVETKLKNKINDWESKFTKNEKRLDWFAFELFKRYSRVVAVRVDGLYHKAVFTPAEMTQIMAEEKVRKERDQAAYMAGEDITTPRVIEGRITLEEVQKDRERLFARMKGKPSLFRHLVGFIWRIEFTKEAGYHLHFMFFFNGAHVQKHEHLAQEIGKYWQDEITQGRGYFENCNRKRARYGDNWALGQISHWETDKRKNLRKTMQYFCKKNQLVQVVPYKKCHLFHCGFVHRQRKVYGGRPRTKQTTGCANQQPGL